MGGSRSARWSHVGRGLLLSAASLFIASMSHVAAGGHAPGPLALVLSSSFSLVFCSAVVGRNLSLVRLVIAVAFSQLLLHMLFSLDAGGEAVTATAHHGVAWTLAASASPTSPDTDAGMWVAHAVAGLLTVAAIRGGHVTARAVRSLARPFVALVRHLSTSVIALPRVPRPASAAYDVPALHTRVWKVSVSRRGPPVRSF